MVFWALLLQKTVVKLEIYDDRDKRKAMKKVSSLSGINSISIDKDYKLTVTGDIDPVIIVRKLKKLCCTELLSVGPAKEEKKDVPKKVEPEKPIDVWRPYHSHYCPHQIMPEYYFVREDPNWFGCLL